MSSMQQYRAEEFLEHVKKSKSLNTYKAYSQAIRRFSEFYGKSPDEILEERRQAWISGDLMRKKRIKLTLEEYHKWLINRGYTQNSARSLIVCFCTLFDYFEMPISDLPGDIVQKVPTTKDYIPTTQQYREMFRVADTLREKLIISMGLNLGWRIGDFAKQLKTQIPDLEKDAPLAYELITEKENVLAKSFLAQETADLLKEYMPTIRNNPNPYLFPSNAAGYYSEESINRTLRELAAKAQIKIPETKRLRFHAFRKRFLCECANASIDVNIAKILCGKDVEDSMLAYLSDVEHREAFIKAHERLKLTETATRKTTMAASELEKRLEFLERKVKLMSAVSPETEHRANKMLEDMGITVTVFADMNIDEKLNLIVEKQREKELAEYARIIAENNNNH